MPGIPITSLTNFPTLLNDTLFHVVDPNEAIPDNRNKNINWLQLQALIGGGGNAFSETISTTGAVPGLVNPGVDDTIALGFDLTTTDGSDFINIGGTNSVILGDSAIAVGFDNSYDGFFFTGNSVQVGFRLENISGVDETVQIGNDITTNAANRTVTIGHDITVNNNADQAIGIGDTVSFTVGSVNSIAIGNVAVIDGQFSIAFGDGAAANADTAIAIGQGATVSGNDGIAIGDGTSATATDAIAFGDGASCAGEDSTAIGEGANVGLSERALAIGDGATVLDGSNEAICLGNNTTVQSLSGGSIAIGTNVNVNGDASIAIGDDADVSGARAISIGNDSFADGNEGIAIGDAAQVQLSATASIAIGDAAQVSAGVTNAIAIGTSCITASNNSVIIGNTCIGGVNGVAIGNGCSVGLSAVAIGDDADTGATGGIAIGHDSFAIGDFSICIGDTAEALAGATNSIAIGFDASIALSTTDAIQLGTGDNSVSNTIQYLSNTIANDTSIEATTQATGVAPTSTPRDGTIIVDENGTGTLWVRVAGVWRSTALA